MNLIQQFPDVSAKIRNKFKLRQSQDKSSTKFYENEFRKWHIKVAFFILLVVASLFFIAFSLSGFFL